MKTRVFFTVMIFSFTLITPLYAVPAAPLTDVEFPDEWESVANGIDYQIFHLTNPRPINIFVARMERVNPDLAIDTSIAQGKLSGGRETISDMASRYDQAINYWGQSWGSRNNVVVAINGYYFDPDGTIWSGLVNSGWYSKRFSDYVGDAGFAWGVSGKAYIGDCVYHKSSKQFITFKKTGYTPNFQEINVPRSEIDPEKIILYTPQYDSDTNTVSTKDEPILEILVEMQRPNLILPAPATADGYIRDIRDKQGSTQLPFDHVVLSVWGDVRATILEKIAIGEIEVGDEIGITQEITDCAKSTQNDWTKTYASIGGDYHFLNDGDVRTDYGNPDAYVANSRTAVAFNDNYIFFVVVDAFDPGVSMGIKIVELGGFLRDQPEIQATDAVTQDSGGSSTMVINGEVVNNTYCNFTRNCGTEIDLEGSVQLDIIGEEELEILYGKEWDDSAGILEPLVGNGVMMVAVEPFEQSTTFESGWYARSTEATNVRLGPGSNYSSLGIIQEGTTGIILDHMNKLNGVWAKSSVSSNSYWWKGEFGNMVGWVKEETLFGWDNVGSIKTYLPSVSR